MSVKPLNDKLTECDKLKSKVKRYFEIKHKGILSIEDTNEHRMLLDEIMELVGIATFDKDDGLDNQEI